MVSVDQIFADLDVSLMDQDSGLMDALGLETFLIDTGLKTFIQELVESETQNVIEFELLIGKKAISVHAVKEGSSFEKSSWVFFFEGEQLSGSFSEIGEQEMNSPYFSLVLQTVLSNQAEFVMNSFFLERSSGSLVC